MKTVVQELIERIEKQIELSAHNKLGTNRTGEYRIGLNKALGFAFDALEAEKKQIIDAFVAGDERGTKEIPFNAEQYYSQTYTG